MRGTDRHTDRAMPQGMRPAWLHVLLAGGLAGCGGNEIQSMLRPEGPAAQEIANLWWLMFGMGGLIFIIVMVLTGVAVFGRKSEDGPPLGGIRFIIAGGVFVPGIVLVVLLIFSIRTTLAIRAPESAITIDVVGHQFWWEVSYPDDDVVIANEIYIPAGEPVRLRLTSQDVIHSFWLPALHGKMDLVPRITNEFWIQADRTGLFRGQCAEFCGTQHALMGFWVHSLEPEEFETWLERRRSPQTQPQTPHMERGLEVFMEKGCDSCHAIEGTAATGVTGPALTDIGSRLTLGAGTVGNSRTNLAQWIINSQSMKPGNLMPTVRLDPADLEALVDYLNSLN